MAEINKAVVSYIAQRKYWLKVTCVSKSKWKRRIVNEWVDSGEYKKYPEHTFSETWDAMKEMGLIEKGA